MSPFAKTAVFTLLIPGFWTVVIPYWILPEGARPATGGWPALGWLLVVSGAALYLDCAFWGFARRGGGTPAPIDPPKKLVVAGPYRFVRNPMYWSVALMMLGEGAVFHSPRLAQVTLGFLAGVLLFVRCYEEPALRRKFGPEYEQYYRKVPGWFPRLRP